MNKNKPNTPIPYIQTHSSRGQHPHQARVANNITNKTPNPPSANTTPIGNTTEYKENNTPIPITNIEETPQPEQTGVEESISSITEPQPEPQSPIQITRKPKMNNQSMMTSLPDYPAHGDPQLPDHAQSHEQSPGA